VRFFFPLARDAAGVLTVPLAMAAASVCLVTIETALINSGESIEIPGTNEKGRRRTGREEARASVKEMSFQKDFQMGNDSYHGRHP